ncbi:MAG: ABC transporter permease subunit [Treponema sp.]|jgi:putative aldouronate transport system permease protein|nr:ABC transporter permease subunit [Treponema sp.]
MANTRIKIKNNWQLYLFLLIPVVYIIIFAYIPMFGAQIAFRRYSPRLGIWGSPWAGLANFKKFFSSYQFVRVVSNTFILSVVSIIISFPIPVIFALLMNSFNSPVFKKVSQTIVNLPHFISTVVLVGMLLQIFNSNTGIYGIFAEYFLGRKPVDLFSKPENFRIMYILSGVWQNFGWDSIIYLAALAGVSIEMHEAAIIDGASRFERILYVDFPAILPTVTIMLILRMGSVMSIGFEKVFLMQNGLNLQVSEVISTYVYKIGLTGSSDFSFSTAIGLFNSVINMILIAIVNFFAGRMGETSLW